MKVNINRLEDEEYLTEIKLGKERIVRRWYRDTPHIYDYTKFLRLVDKLVGKHVNVLKRKLRKDRCYQSPEQIVRRYMLVLNRNGDIINEDGLVYKPTHGRANSYLVNSDGIISITYERVAKKQPTLTKSEILTKKIDNLSEAYGLALRLYKCRQDWGLIPPSDRRRAMRNILYAYQSQADDLYTAYMHSNNYNTNKFDGDRVRKIPQRYIKALKGKKEHVKVRKVEVIKPTPIRVNSPYIHLPGICG